MDHKHRYIINMSLKTVDGKILFLQCKCGAFKKEEVKARRIREPLSL